jgi:hypothetical protein
VERTCFGLPSLSENEKKEKKINIPTGKKGTENERRVERKKK